MRTDSRMGESVEQRAARWLTTIAQLEQVAAADIDEGGFPSEVACWLRRRAADSRATASAVAGARAPRRRLRLRAR